MSFAPARDLQPLNTLVPLLSVNQECARMRQGAKGSGFLEGFTAEVSFFFLRYLDQRVEFALAVFPAEARKSEPPLYPRRHACVVQPQRRERHLWHRMRGCLASSVYARPSRARPGRRAACLSAHRPARPLFLAVNRTHS